MKELEEKTKSQEMFTNNFAHELKTPLTSMIGYADLIRSNQLSEEKLITYANQIVVEGRRLEKMSMKLMDLIVLKTNVYDMSGKLVGEIELSEAVFGITPNESVVHDVVKNHLANKRQGTQSALTRAEVSGGGRKPWRQKGTGRARQGSTRAPQWTHGGIVFAPKPRSYSYTLNKKAKRLALKSVLSAKASEANIVVIDAIKMDAPKTSEFAKFLKAVGCEGKTLVVTAAADQNVVKSGRNIPGCEVTFAGVLNVYDVLNATKLVVDKAALATIEEVFA